MINKRKLCIRQHDTTDCGAACLASISAYYGHPRPIAAIRQQAGTNQEGTTLYGLTKAAEALDFDARGVRVEDEGLNRLPHPSVAHLQLPNGVQHFVVLYRAGDRSVEVMDPTDGRLHKWTRSEFEQVWSGILLLLIPSPEFRKGKGRPTLFRRLWQIVQPHRGVLIQALIGAALYTLAGLSIAIYVQILVDHVLTGDNRSLLHLMGIALVTIITLQTLIGTLKTLFVLKTGQLIDARLLLGYYNHLLKLPQSFFDSMRTGELISRLNDAVNIRTFINDTALQLAVNLFVVFFSFLLMFTTYWKLGLFLLLIIPAYLIIYLITNHLNKRAQRSVMEDSAELEAQLIESLQGISTIKQFGLEHTAGLKSEIRFIQLLRSVYRSGLNAIFASSSTEWISSGFTVLTLWIGSLYVLDGSLTAGELLSFYAIIGYFTGPATEMIGMNRSVQDALIAGDRLFQIMDLEEEDRQGTLNLSDGITNEIRFEDVLFSYNHDKPALDGLNLSIQAGTVTALVGESGSGKSTLVKLLQKLYTPDDGRICVDGTNLEHIETRSLRRNVAAVPQKTDLFIGSIADNIAIGDPDPDPRKIYRLCEQLGMIPFIETLPNGFDTVLGENGSTLSGGQRQRISFARALYRNPSLLLMDEATSSIDSIAEQQIQTAVRTFANGGNSVLLIAHRLHSILIADRICLLKNGKAVESGTHLELLKMEGEYYRLWKSQHPETVIQNGHREPKNMGRSIS